jgi:meiotic recombination protein SPO11
MIRITDILTSAIKDNRTLTPREIYYLQKGAKHAVKTSEGVSNILRLLGLAIRVPRSSLHVYAPCKGVLIGDIVIETTTFKKEVVKEVASKAQLSIRSDVTRKSSTKIKLASSSSRIRFILIVEKETVFHELVCNNVHNDCILVTGKGMPCLGTRAFVKLLHDTMPTIPILGLCDWNPYGLGIMCTYAHGGSSHPEGYLYAIPRLKCIGMLYNDVEHYGQYLARHVQPITQQDRVKAQGLKLDYSRSTCTNIGYELDQMLRANYKLELESLNQMSGYPDNFLSTRWLTSVIQNQLSSSSSSAPPSPQP